MSVDLLILNYNGRHLLAECLPSVLHAAACSRHECRVVVVDNASSDGSQEYLAEQFPEVVVAARPNRGLTSLNDVLSTLTGNSAVLLNNDVQLAAEAIDPLVAPFESPSGAADENCFMTAPLCWRFDGQTYEGLKTSVRWRWGLVQATALYVGHESSIYLPGFTASAGAVMAVDRAKFLRLGGFDPIYLPGRLEDLDFAFRGYLAGYHARYVPSSVAYHMGGATFDREMGRRASDHLALRNTLLFQWKNLRAPRHVLRHVAGLAARLACDLLRAPRLSSAERWGTWRALYQALRRAPALRQRKFRAATDVRAELDFFRLFHPQRIDRLAGLALALHRRTDNPSRPRPHFSQRNRLQGVFREIDESEGTRDVRYRRHRRWN